MHGNAHLVMDLGVVLICAAFVTLFFKKLKLPVFLGYLLAGLLIGPNVWERGPINNPHDVEQLAGLGLIFLMFYIGLEFDLRRLKRVLGPASLALGLQAGVMIFFGVQVAMVLGWNYLQGLFLGGLLSISSSMVSISLLQDLNRMHKPHAQLAIGVLILEDILAIILLVVLSALAVSGATAEGGFDLKLVLKTTFLIGAFVVAVFFMGRIVAPRLLRQLEAWGSVEMITVWVLALMLGLSMLAEQFHFSSALGAFLAGGVLSQTTLADEIERTTEPLRNIFSAVFFVSIGMLIDPPALFSNLPVILLLALFVSLCKVATVWLGLMLGGEPPATSFRAATVKAQIGEFSFVIVSAGIVSGVTDSQWMAVAVGTAVVTAFTSMLLARHADPLYQWLSRRTPKSLHTAGRFYLNLLDSGRQQLSGSVMWRLLRRPMMQVTFNFFLISALIIAASVGVLLLKKTVGQGEVPAIWGLTVWLSSALFCLPFITSIIRNINAMAMVLTEALLKGTSAANDPHGRFRQIVSNCASGIVLAVTAALYLTAMAPYMPQGGALVVVLVLATIAAVLYWKRFIRLNSRLEILFMESFNQEAPDSAALSAQSMIDNLSRQYPWNVAIEELTLAPGDIACGNTLRQLRLRELSGVTVVGIARSGQVALDPPADALVFPGDQLYLFGEPEQVARASEVVCQKTDDPDALQSGEPTFQIEKILLTPRSELVDQTLASANLRRQKGITVLGIQRGKEQLTNPDPHFIFHPGDLLYVIGNRAEIKRLQIAAQETRAPFRLG